MLDLRNSLKNGVSRRYRHGCFDPKWDFTFKRKRALLAVKLCPEVQRTSYPMRYASFRGRHVEARLRGAPERKGQPQLSISVFKVSRSQK